MQTEQHTDNHHDVPKKQKRKVTHAIQTNKQNQTASRQYMSIWYREIIN